MDLRKQTDLCSVLSVILLYTWIESKLYVGSQKHTELYPTKSSLSFNLAFTFLFV
jgi:hypothetical protein